MAGRHKYNAHQPKRPFKAVEGIGTDVFNRLSRNAVFVLVKLYEKFNGYNRYDLSLPYKEIENKMANVLFSRSIWELIGFGFVDVKRFGRLERNCSLYGLSNRWRKLNDQPEKLEQIQKLLSEIETLKRQKGDVKKRMAMFALRKKILELGTS